MRLTIVGCSGSFPGPDSPASCYLVEAAHDGGTFRLVVDLGSGALGHLQRYASLESVDAVVLSHLHADHWFGLPGMLKTFDLRDRSKPLEIYGPAGTKAVLDRVQPVFGRLGYPLEIEELDAELEPDPASGRRH